METSVRNSRKNGVRQADGDRKAHPGQRETDKQESIVLLKNSVSFSGIAKARTVYGGLAQLVERLLCKQDVIGSSPLFSTIWANSSAG